MEHADIWPLAWEALIALRAHYGPAINHAAEELGIPYGEWYGWLMAAHIFDPEPISAARLHERAAYTNPARLEEHLQSGVRLGLLAPEPPGGYRLTERGDAGVAHLIQSAYAAMAPLRPLPDPEMGRLVELLHCLVSASMEAPEPPAKRCLRLARRYDPGMSAPPMVRLDQYLSDLDAYCDDARLATWPSLGVSAQAWDAFSQVWRHGRLTPDELHVHLARRGWPAGAYAAALEALAHRGWASREDEGYGLTEEGVIVREQAEARINDYFYAPWACLTAEEIAELRGLLAQIRDTLEPPEALAR